jgi:hypothetical protein
MTTMTDLPIEIHSKWLQYFTLPQLFQLRQTHSLFKHIIDLHLASFFKTGPRIVGYFSKYHNTCCPGYQRLLLFKKFNIFSFKNTHSTQYSCIPFHSSSQQQQNIHHYQEDLEDVEDLEDQGNDYVFEQLYRLEPNEVPEKSVVKLCFQEA